MRALVLFGLLLGVPAMALDCPTIITPLAKRDATALLQYMSDNDFPSFECFLQSLPKDILASRTYLRSSVSVQEASATNPRVIVAEPKGGFYITFNGEKTQKGFNEIEVLGIDNAEQPTRWIPATVKVENGHVRAHTEVTTCTQCHGSNVRPVWTEYFSWPAAFGSVDDWMPDPSDVKKGSYHYADDYNSRLMPDQVDRALKDRTEFLAFRAQAISNPRYAILEAVSDPASPVFPYTENYRDRNSAFRPNANISSSMVFRHSQILAQRIENSAFYQKFRSTVLYFGYCRGYQDEVAVKDRFNKEHRTLYGRDMVGEQAFIGQSPFSFDEYELMDVRPEELTLYLAPSMDQLDTTQRFFNSGTDSLMTNLTNRLMYDELSQPKFAPKYTHPKTALPKKYPKFKDATTVYFQSLFSGVDDYVWTNQSTPGLHLTFHVAPGAFYDAKLCKMWEAKAENELKAPPFYHAPIEAVTPAVPVPNGAPARLSECISCHDSSNRIATAIPFGEPDQLVTFAKTFIPMLGGRDFLDDVRYLTRSDTTPAHLGGYRMPFGHEPLSDDDRKQLLDWLDGVVNQTR